MSISDLVPWKWGKQNVSVHHQDSNDPFRKLQNRMGKLFDDFWSDFEMSPYANGASSEMNFEPKIDLQDKDNDVVLRAELPGMTQDDIEVKLHDGYISIKGEKKNESSKNENGIQYTERSYGSFYRSIPLPYEVKEDEVNAEFKNGVLEVNMPKVKNGKMNAKKIEVK